MLTLQYYIHILLQSKYKFFIILFVYGVLYMTLKSTYLIECMTEDNGIPIIAEAKETNRPSHQVIALREEIKEFAGTQATLLETIEHQNLEIKQLRRDLRMLAKNYIRIDYERLDYRSITMFAKSVSVNDPFFREDDSLIEELKRNHTYIFQEGGKSARDQFLDREWERGLPSLMYYGDIANPKEHVADY